jgi:transcriptional regulator GlxA family with amidase domain
MLEGEGQLEQHRRLSRQKPGDIVVYDAAQPFLYDLLERHRLVLLKIPRRAMLARVPEAETCTSQLISGETALGSLAATIIRDAASLNIDDAHAAARIGTSILDIIAAAIDVELVRNVPALNHQATVFNRAQEYIRSHLDDPDITVDSIADGICISTSTLARLFAGAGTTVMRWLWEERLTVGHRALVEGRAQRVTEVALMCGFTSFSHFSRRFRARFGHSPSALIRENSISHCASTAPS